MEACGALPPATSSLRARRPVPRRLEMLLAIDAGNTNVVFAVFDGERRLGSWRISTDHNRTSDEYAVWLTHLMALVQLRPLDIPETGRASGRERVCPSG